MFHFCSRLREALSHSSSTTAQGCDADAASDAASDAATDNDASAAAAAAGASDDDDEATLNCSEDAAPPGDPMQVDEAVSPNQEVSISDSISEHTSTTTTSNSDSTLTLDAAAPGEGAGRDCLLGYLCEGLIICIFFSRTDK